MKRNWYFLFSDQIKEDAQSVVSGLKKLGKRVVLLSGDVERNVRVVAEKVGICGVGKKILKQVQDDDGGVKDDDGGVKDDNLRPRHPELVSGSLHSDNYYFEQTPISKVEFLQKLKSQNHKVLMIGDGLNDAPSLAAADVSISFSDASDISQNIADIVIQGHKLEPIITVISSSKKAITLMKQNLLIALIYNLIALPFAVLGFVVPLVAAFAMSSSSILVLLNSLRMSGSKSQK